MDKVILVKQRHEALKAGKHWDWRVVVGDKAFSWATKKEANNPGDKLVLWEQPVHDKEYALSEHITIPKGQYGAGETFLEYAQKGTAKITKDEYHLELNNGDKYFIKKMPSWDDKAWLLVNVSKPMNKQADKKEKHKKKHLHVYADDLQSLSNVKQYKTHKGHFKLERGSIPGVTKALILSRIQNKLIDKKKD